MAQAPISPFDADAKAIQALVVKEEKSSKGYRESVYNLMVVLYETGLKYENTESVIDGWLAQHDLVQKRGKESSLWNKICKVAFCLYKKGGFIKLFILLVRPAKE